MTDYSGQLVEFIDKGQLILALVQTDKKGRLAVLTSQDKQMTIPQNRGLLFTPSALPANAPRDNLVVYLKKTEVSRDSLADKVQVAELWDLLQAESEPLDLNDLAGLCFSGAITSEHSSAVLRALLKDHTFFRLSEGLFTPLSQEQLELKKLQQERQEAQRQKYEAYAQYLKSLPAQGPVPAEAPEDLIELLIQLAILTDDPTKKLQDSLARLGLTSAQAAFDLLVRLGIFNIHENLELRREGVSPAFLPEVLAAAQAIPALTPDVDDRQDLTDLFTFTIDGSQTTDFDDALSFEQLPDGQSLLSVHITDVASVLPLNGPLEDEARFRATSLYFPDARISMLPAGLSEEILALCQGEIKPALTVQARISDQGQIVDYHLARTWIRVDKRLTYDEVDQLLAQNEPLSANLQTLAGACDLLRRQRELAGAYFLPLPEVLVGIGEDEQVWVRRVDEEGPARRLVAETAILANQVYAQYALSHNIPSLYRVQPASREPFQTGEADDLFLHFKQRRLLQRVDISLKPGRHHGLGLEPYVQLTSPIRRYLDLVMQRQISQYAHNQTWPYEPQALKTLVQEVEPNLTRSARLRRTRQRYWLLRWLEQNQGTPLPAIVMEPQFKRWQILLTDIMQLSTLPLVSAQEYRPGQKIAVKVTRVNPREDILRIAPV